MEALTLIFNLLKIYITSTPWWVLVIQFFLLWLAYLSIKGIYVLTIIRLSGRHHKPLSYIRNSGKKILLAGDSTAVGTGSINSAKTLGGFLANDFPNTDIINVSVNGALTGQVVEQLTKVSGDKFDLIIISIGGNDVWAATRSKKLTFQLATILDLAKKMSNNKVVVVFFGNEGSAPFFPLFMSGYLLRQTERVRRIFTQVATREHIPVIELFSKAKDNPFVKDPNKFFAPDGLHPNENGYWEWYKHLWRLMINNNYHFEEDLRAINR